MTLLLAGLVFLVFFVAGARAVSWFFGGTKNVQDDEPVTGYSDPVRDGRMRW